MSPRGKAPAGPVEYPLTSRLSQCSRRSSSSPAPVSPPAAPRIPAAISTTVAAPPGGRPRLHDGRRLDSKLPLPWPAGEVASGPAIWIVGQVDAVALLTIDCDEAELRKLGLSIAERLTA